MGYEPSECIVVEDSLLGIQAARSGGFDVLCLVNKYNEKLFKNTDSLLFYDMSKLDLLLSRN